MNANHRVRRGIRLLSLLVLLALVLGRDSRLSLIFVAACILAALFLLYRHMNALVGLSEDNPKGKTLRAVTIFDGVLFGAVMVLAALGEAGVLRFSEMQEKYFVAVLVSGLLLFLGNVAPKIPFNRYTGLRLPWTVSDEDTWIVAHRILGYISIPLALLYLAGIPAIANFEALSVAVLLLWIGIPSGLSLLFYCRKMRGMGSAK